MYKWTFYDWFNFYIDMGENEEQAKFLAKKAIEEESKYLTWD